jgi:hypothetical protein
MKPRIITFYLPQYYPTDFNNKWWEPGFTEWTNVAKAKPLFPGHYQPKLPGELGFYDLRVADTREKQASLARKAGVESFMYWHYWTGGRKVLNEVFEEVVNSGHPDFGFSICWANHSWAKNAWNGTKKAVTLLEQLYPGNEDNIAHFNDLLPAFKDKRYTRVNGKLLFAVFAPFNVPNTHEFFDTWNRLAEENGLGGFYFLALNKEPNRTEELKTMGYDGVINDLMDDFRASHYMYTNIFFRALRKFGGVVFGNNYLDYCNFFINEYEPRPNQFPCIYPNWDHSARSGNIATIFRNAAPGIWGDFCKRLFIKCRALPAEENLIFIKSWNEWGEGNYLEPDRRYGRGYLEELKKALTDC